MGAAGLRDGDLIMLLRNRPSAAGAGASAPNPMAGPPPALRLDPNDGAAVDPNAFIEYILGGA